MIAPASAELPSPLAASLQVHEELWHARKDIEEVLGWAKWASIWLLSLGGLAVAWIFTRNSPVAATVVDVVGLLDLVLGGLWFVVTSVGVLRSSWRSGKQVEEWEDSMLPILYRIKFELLPYTGPNREQDIWERFKSIYRDLSDADSNTLRARIRRGSGTTILKFHEEIKGKKARHTFDVYGTVGLERGLFVRRFKEAEPVSKAQLEALKVEVEDRLKRAKEGTCIVAAFSAAGFDQGAIDFAQSEEGFIDGDYPMDLLKEIDTGYTVVFVDSG